MSILSDPQSAALSLRLGKRARLKMRVDVTPVGLLAVSVLVSGILLSTKALVRTAISESRR